MSSAFVWAIKNGDLEQVKDIIEKQVVILKFIYIYLLILPGKAGNFMQIIL